MKNKSPKLRKASGFTILELLTAILIISILICIAIPTFIGNQEKAKNASVISNMHMTQVAAESYSVDNVGVFPPTPSEMAPYYPQGGNTPGGAPGNYPRNPYSGAANEAPFTESIADTAGVETTRASSPGAAAGTAGQVGYNRCDEPAGTSYCVTGVDAKKIRLASSGGKTLVLSNH